MNSRPPTQQALKVGVLLLAAGRSRRFGSDKRQATLTSGRTLLDTTLMAISHSALPVTVCLAASDGALARALTARGIRTVVCKDAAAGMGHTLANGVVQRPAGWTGLLVALADMPWVLSNSYRAIAETLTTGTIVVPTYRGQRGNPVGFGAGFFDALSDAHGDQGGRDILRRHPGAIHEVALDDPGLLRDVDTVGALRRAAD